MNSFYGKNSQSVIKGPSKKRLNLSTTVFIIVFFQRLKKRPKKTKHRGFILDEWLKTQYSYCRDLKLSERFIRSPMISQKMITPQDSQILFPQLEGMIQLSNMMIAVLEKAKAQINPNKIMIGKDIEYISHGFKIYCEYFNVHSRKQQILNELTDYNQQEMKEIQQNLQKQMKKLDASKQAITIKDSMEEPLYRLFKYVLFLKDYIKKLPTSHPDYEAVNKAMQTLHETNNKNNDIMKKNQQHEKTNKLNSLFGGIIKNATRQFIAEMQADTIYSPGKIYIFNDLVIVTKIQKILGTQKQQKLQIMELDEFSYINEQRDMKYFSHILILIGKEQCVHLLFANEGSRFQVYKCLNKVLKELRIKSQDRRKVESLQKQNNEHKKKIKFTLKQDSFEQFMFRPEFRVEIIGFQVRPISAMNNDTVYITRFMMPVYYKDELLELETKVNNSKVKKEEKLKRINSLPFSSNKYNQQQEFQEAGLKKNPNKYINQRVEIHFSQLQSLYNMITSKFQGNFPKIDPITKQVNLYSKGKKKTILFEMRKFLIEQFFNYVFRHQNVLQNPINLIQNTRINTHFWDYVTNRNFSIITHSNKKSYGPHHCHTCEKSQIKSIEEYEHYRNFFLNDGNHLSNRSSDKYCFNFFNLARSRLLEFSYICFNTLERILLFYHYSQGRIDYPFLPHLQHQQKKILRVHLASLDDDALSITFTETSTVGEILDEIGMSFGMNVCFDYELLAIFNGRRRILDRDQLIIDSVKTLNLKCFDVQGNSQSKSKGNVLGAIKKWGHEMFSKQEIEVNRVYFYKTTYMHKSLQLKSLQKNQKKKKLQLERIFWSIREGLIKLSDSDFVQIAASYYIIKQSQNLAHLSANKINKRTMNKIIPQDKIYAYQNYAEMKREIGILVERERDLVLKSSRGLDQLVNKIFQIVWKIKDYYTYYIFVEPKKIPPSQCKAIPSSCLLGVNYKSIIVTRSQIDHSPITQIFLEDINFFTSVFSIFITHNVIGDFRFDSKLVYHFGQIAKKFQTIAKRFPQHRA